MLAEGTEIAPAFLKEIQERHRKIKSVMTAGATTVTEDTLAREIALLMYHQGRVKRVPVLRDGRKLDGRRGAFRSCASTRPKARREASP